jgi:hypothetical protein
MTVPILINFYAAALDSLLRMKVISAVQVAIDKKKTKTWAEIGAVIVTLNGEKS